MNRSWFHSFLYECPVVHCSSTCPTFPQQFSPYPLCHLCYTSRVYISVDLFLYCLFCSIHLFLYHYINILKSYLLLLFSRSVVSDSLWPWTAARQASLSFTCFPEFAQTHVLWVSDAIQPSHPVTTFSSCPQSFPPSGSFPVSQLFASGGQRIGASASVSVLPMSIQGWFPLGWTGLILLQSKGLWRVFSNTTVQSYQFFDAQPFLFSNSHIRTWLLEKPKLWLYGPLSAK